MTRYRIHRIKDTPRESFRWAAHTGGTAIVKPKDYDSNEEVESSTPYAAWKALQDEGNPLRPGDVLESLPGGELPGELRIAKYIGFEPAQWWIPEPKPSADAAPAALPEAASPASESQHS